MINKYIDNIGTNEKHDIRVTGGEPFLHKDIIKILEIISRSVQPISKHTIVTNGSFDIKKAYKALELGFDLQISVYGTNSNTFEQFTNTNKHLFNKVCNNLNLLSKSKYANNIKILFSVNNLTFNQIDEFVKYIYKLGFKYILNRPASVGRSVKNWDKIQMPINNYLNFAKRTNNQAQTYSYHLCQLHWTSVNINGDITPCSFFRSNNTNFVMGNLLNDSLNNVWNNNKYNEFRKLSVSNIKLCSKCEFEYICTAGCCAEALSFKNDIYSSYPWCIVKPYELNSYLSISNKQIYKVIKLAAGAFDFLCVN